MVRASCMHETPAECPVASSRVERPRASVLPPQDVRLPAIVDITCTAPGGTHRPGALAVAVITMQPNEPKSPLSQGKGPTQWSAPTSPERRCASDMRRHGDTPLRQRRASDTRRHRDTARSDSAGTTTTTGVYPQAPRSTAALQQNRRVIEPHRLEVQALMPSPAQSSNPTVSKRRRSRAYITRGFNLGSPPARGHLTPHNRLTERTSRPAQPPCNKTDESSNPTVSKRTRSCPPLPSHRTPSSRSADAHVPV
jgi:hypothetical protein